MNINTTNTSFRKLYAFGTKLPIDLSLSENPLGCSPKVSSVLKNLTQADFFDYPDPDCNQLKKLISRRFEINADSIFVANGSEAIIKLIPQVLLKPGDDLDDFILSKDEMKVNGKNVPQELHKKHLELYKKYFGKDIGDEKFRIND